MHAIFFKGQLGKLPLQSGNFGSKQRFFLRIITAYLDVGKYANSLCKHGKNTNFSKLIIDIHTGTVNSKYNVHNKKS